MEITGCAAIKSVCSEYRIHNADVYMKEDCDVDDLVDVIEGSRVYIPCIYVINKIDQVPPSLFLSMLLSALSCSINQDGSNLMLMAPYALPYRTPDSIFKEHCSVRGP